MIRRRARPVVPVLLLALSACTAAETSTALPRGVPEQEGVRSAAVMRFLDAVEQRGYEFHSFMFVRHGKVIAEGWWNPYAPHLKHTMYSTSKSFTSTAIGFAVAERRISVDDRVVSFFPDDLPESVSPALAALRIRDVISMTTGQDPDPTGIVARDTNWVATFLATPIVHEPGSRFLYNTLGTYVLSAIITAATGEPLIDYLRPRLFAPLGITDVDWEVDPQGRNTGGWGLRLRTEDMAKFGQLYLQRGKWNGEQILPAAWIDEATTAAILQAPDLADSVRAASDWLQGYGYQFWRCRHNAFRADGAFGQFIIVMPDQDAVVVITSESADMQGEINLVWEHLLPAMQDGPLPEDRDMQARLTDRLAALALPPPRRGEAPALAAAISGRTYAVAPNDRGIDSLSFQFTGDTCTVALTSGGGVATLGFGAGAWRLGETTRRGPYLIATAKAAYVGLPPLRVAGAYRWDDQRTLRLVLRYVESPHSETLICRFDGDEVSVSMGTSLGPMSAAPTLTGRLATAD
jgi:CubicO group peptidase (beta-lactamase class C family)